MRRVGQTRRRDANEAAIVEALRAHGIEVWRISSPGFADLVTFQPRVGRWMPLEVKRPNGTLTPRQRATRIRAPYPVVETVAEALAVFGIDTH